MIQQHTYVLRGGSNELRYHALVMVEVLWVARLGLEYRVVSGAPGNREVQYSPALGSLTFLNEGIGTRLVSEKIDIICKA